MKRDFNPVDVKLNIENPFIERDAFYRLCFITESNIAPRTLKVTRLQDLLDNGYSRLDLAYNFCVGVFSQQGIDTVYIRAKRSSESYVEAYNSDDNSMYYFVVLQTKDLIEIEKFNNHLVSSDEMKLQFFSQNVGSKTLQSPKLVNYYQDYTRPEGGVSSNDRDFYLNSAYEGSVSQIKLSLPDYLLSGLGDVAIEYGIYNMSGKKQIWEIDKAERRIRYAPEVLQQGWVGSKEDSTVNGSDITVVAYKGSDGVSKKSTVLNPIAKIETLSRELLKGLGKEALDYAIPLIDPEAKDWELDATNNRIKYTVPAGAGGDSPDSPPEGAQHNYTIDYNPETKLWRYDSITGATPQDTCASYQGDDWYNVGAFNVTEERAECWFAFEGSGVPAYDGAPVEKSIPIDTVSQQVIANADSGHLESKEFLKSIPLFAYILTGSGTEAVNKAVLDIDPKATDWILDPVNNRVKYTITESSWSNNYDGLSYPTDDAAGAGFCSRLLKDSPNASCTYSIANNKAYALLLHSPTNTESRDTNLTRDILSSVLSYIPIDVVAAQVISNAEASHAPSQEALRLSTVERVNTGEYDEALESASIEIDTSWKYLPIYDVAVQVKRNSIAGHAESIEAVNNSLPFELPDNNTPWACVPEETSVTGSTTTIKAKRTFENQKLKSSITVAASASKVGESLIKGGGQAALLLAVPQLIGEGVEWVLDPANNRIKYTSAGVLVPDDGAKVNFPIQKYDDGLWYFSKGTDGEIKGLTPDIVCSSYVYSTSSNAGAIQTSETTANCYYYPQGVPVPPAAGVEKYLPIDTVAAKVIANAESGHAPSQDAVKAAALEGFVAGEHDVALDAAAVIDN